MSGLELRNHFSLSTSNEVEQLCIAPCKANKIEPYKYFCKMLHKIRLCTTDEDYQNLLPQNIQLD